VPSEHTLLAHILCRCVSSKRTTSPAANRSDVGLNGRQQPAKSFFSTRRICTEYAQVTCAQKALFEQPVQTQLKQKNESNLNLIGTQALTRFNHNLSQFGSEHTQDIFGTSCTQYTRFCLNRTSTRSI